MINKEIAEQIATATSTLTEEVAGKEADLEAAGRELDELNERLQTVTEQKTDLERENARLAGAQEEAQKQIKSLQAQVAAVTDQYNSQCEETRGLQGRIASAEQAITEKSTLEQVIDELQQNLAELPLDQMSKSLNRILLSLANALENGDELKAAISRAASKASINPMAYVDKAIVEYKNPGKSLTAPYATSAYSGMLMNYGL